MSSKLYDVIVIGAGPVGSRVARLMAERGYMTLVLDRKKEIDEPVCCTGIVGQECAERFHIDPSVIFSGASGATLFSPSGRRLHIERPQTQAVILDRRLFNAWMAHLAVEAGAVIRLDTSVSGIRQETDHVSIQVSGRGELTAKAVVIANGFGSKLPGMAGLGDIGDFAMGVQAEVETVDINEVEVYSGRAFAPGFFAWLVPTAPGRGLAGLMSRRDTGRYMKHLLEWLESQGKIRKSGQVIRFSGVALKPMNKTVTDRILVAGSAAGQVKPVTGGGIYYGLLCADIASDVLHHGFQTENLTEACLETYDRRWGQVLGRDISTSWRVRKFYEKLGDPAVDKAFGLVIRSGIDKILLESPDVSFDWHGAVIRKLLGYEALSGILKRLFIPSEKGK